MRFTTSGVIGDADRGVGEATNLQKHNMEVHFDESDFSTTSSAKTSHATSVVDNQGLQTRLNDTPGIREHSTRGRSRQKCILY